MEELLRGCSKVCLYWIYVSRLFKIYLFLIFGGGSNISVFGYIVGRFFRKVGYLRRVREVKWYKGREKIKMKNKYYLMNGNFKYFFWI